VEVRALPSKVCISESDEDERWDVMRQNGFDSILVRNIGGSFSDGLVTAESFPSFTTLSVNIYAPKR
jgi:hypothetical protein